MTIMIVSHLVKAGRDNSLFNKSTTPQIQKAITTQMMDISKMAIESDIQVSPTIHTNYDLKSSIQPPARLSRKRGETVAAEPVGYNRFTLLPLGIRNVSEGKHLSY